MLSQPSILLAFDTVLDISENDIVSLLHSVIVPHRRTRVADDAMEVDSPPSQSQSDLIPSLPVFLSSCVSYATSPAPLRLALHQHLSDVEDIIPVLEVLNGWVTEWNAFSLKLVPTMVVKNPKGVTIAKPQRLSKAGTPPLELVRGYASTWKRVYIDWFLLGSPLPPNPFGCFISEPSPTPTRTRHPASYIHGSRARASSCRRNGAAPWSARAVCQGPDEGAERERGREEG